MKGSFSCGDPPLTTRHLERAVAQVQPTTLEWLQTARNHAEFANQGGRYDSPGVTRGFS